MIYFKKYELTLPDGTKRYYPTRNAAYSAGKLFLRTQKFYSKAFTIVPKIIAYYNPNAKW